MIQGEKVKLRSLEREDLDHWCRWFNDAEVMQYYPERIYPYSRADAEEFFQRVQGSQTDKVFAIETKEGLLIGNVGLHHINWPARHAELGIMIGEKDYWDKGYGTDVIKTMVRFAFEKMNLQRIYLRVADFNARAIACYKKCGFREEGRLREHTYNNGRYIDELIMGVLRTELV
ncbi:MAG: GNAT family N-acetyltransferase [Chloroflexi bacterium]|nr:GNAT family N-acetyltransferase [Chloroflexota bacterium]MCL5076241.1 GNAT family N-acetyltransferase [Chloroflexota bacterium]